MVNSICLSLSLESGCKSQEHADSEHHLPVHVWPVWLYDQLSCALYVYSKWTQKWSVMQRALQLSHKHTQDHMYTCTVFTSPSTTHLWLGPTSLLLGIPYTDRRNWLTLVHLDCVSSKTRAIPSTAPLGYYQQSRFWTSWTERPRLLKCKASSIFFWESFFLQRLGAPTTPHQVPSGLKVIQR